MNTKKKRIVLHILSLSITTFCLFLPRVNFAGEQTRFSFGRLQVNLPPTTHEPKGKVMFLPPMMDLKEGKLKVENSHYRLYFDTSPSLSLSSIYNKYSQIECLTTENNFSRLFFLWVDSKRLDSKDFKVEDIKINRALNESLFYLSCPESQVKGKLSISINDSSEIYLTLSFTNHGNQKREFRVIFPYFENLMLGNKSEDNYYFFPFKGGWCSNKAFELSVPYGHPPGSIQLLSLYNPELGCGIYTRLDDNSGRMKTIMLGKRGERPTRRIPSYAPIFPEMKLKDEVFPLEKGVVMAYYSLPYILRPEEELYLPAAVLGIHPGDFKFALKSYANWAHTWFKPLKIPQWLKDSFVYVVSHDIAGNTGYEKGFIKDNKMILSKLVKPYEHYLELAYWSNHSRTDFEGTEKDYAWYRNTIGDYTYEEEWGGLSALREEFGKVQEIGPHVSLYGATPYMAWKYSKVFKEHPDWVLINERGEPEKDYWGDFGEVKLRYIDFCPQVGEWQDYLAETNKRIVKDTGVSGLFLDTMNIIRFCYNPKHKHEEYPAIAAEKILKKIVSAVRSVNPEAIVNIEDVCSDYLMQWIDGTWIKTFSGDQAHATDFDLYSIHFLRFYFPEIKYAEWGPNFEDGGRRTFFNGIGYLRGDLKDITDKETGKIITKREQLDYLIITGQLMKENGDAFSSFKAECLIPTLKENVFANRFPTESKVLYTLYNKNDSQVKGEIIKSKPRSNYHCVELLYDEEVSFDDSGTVSLNIGPWEVVCVAILPNIMELERQDADLNIRLNRSLSLPSLRLFIDYDDGKENGKELKIEHNLIRINLKEYQGEQMIIKLFEGNYLIDERILKLG